MHLVQVILTSGKLDKKKYCSVTRTPRHDPPVLKRTYVLGNKFMVTHSLWKFQRLAVYISPRSWEPCCRRAMEDLWLVLVLAGCALSALLLLCSCTLAARCVSGGRPVTAEYLAEATLTTTDLERRQFKVRISHKFHVNVHIFGLIVHHTWNNRFSNWYQPVRWVVLHKCGHFYHYYWHFLIMLIFSV